MKTKLHLTGLLLLLLIAVCVNAQHPVSVKKNNSGNREYNRMDDEKFTERRAASSSAERTTYYVPLNETDSVYDLGTGTWSYDKDVQHTYYHSNCRDSVVTSTVSGTNTQRETFQYDQWDFTSYDLTETWNGTSWVNYSLNIGQALAIGCFTQYLYFFDWNVSAWDTIYGLRSSSVIYDANNNPTEIVRQRYLYNTWKNSYKYTFSYNASQERTAWSRFNWDSISGQYIPDWRDTNFTFHYYNSLCDFHEASSEHQTWNGTAWQNDTKEFFSPPPGNTDTTYFLLWNGSAYADSSFKRIFEYNNFGDIIGQQDYSYNTVTGSWSIGYYDWFFNTYGTNNEVLRSEEINDFWTPTYDSIAPDKVFRYSNFISCSSVLGTDERIAGADGFRIFPNPANNQLTIESSGYPGLKISSVEIYDVVGEKRLTLNLSPKGEGLLIDVSSLAPGIYFVKLKGSGGERVAKFVKQ